jgi:hypothetical protein
LLIQNTTEILKLVISDGEKSIYFNSNAMGEVQKQWYELSGMGGTGRVKRATNLRLRTCFSETEFKLYLKKDLWL